ncbi:MAG: GntP family permease [Cyclobacteriaceae bacterium]
METISYWPLIVLFIGIAAVIIQIAVFKIHAFVSLTMSAILVGILSVTGDGALVKSIEMTMTEMGTTAGKIAFVIALASVLGLALTESGAAEKIVIKFLGVFGEKFAPVALLLAGFILAIPVFFDTVFFLVIPLAMSLGKRFGKNYMFYVLAVGIGGVLTHSIVPPTPGPLIMAESLSINLGLVILIGLIACILPAVLTYFFARKISAGYDLKVPDLGASSQPNEDDLPSFGLSMVPIVVPLLLIIVSSTMDFIAPNAEGSTVAIIIGFLGNKNMAMLIGTILALWLLAKQKGWGMKELSHEFDKPLELAGVIILITSAGGAFGAMIKNSGIGQMIEGMTSQGVSLNFVLLAWVISAVMKIAQGSSTVAMITTAGIMVALMQSVEIPFHPIYVYLSIGFGSLMGSWMNDSGFWVVAKLSGIPQGQMLKTWTVMLGVISLIGLIQALLLSYIIPLV